MFYGPGFRALSVSTVVSNPERETCIPAVPNLGSPGSWETLRGARGRTCASLMSASALAPRPPGRPGDGATGTLGAHPNGAGGHTWWYLGAPKHLSTCEPARVPPLLGGRYDACPASRVGGSR